MCCREAPQAETASGTAADQRRGGGDDAGLALAIQAIGSVLVLNAILWLALIVSIPLTGFNPIYATAALVGALLLAAFATLVLLLTKGEERALSP